MSGLIRGFAALAAYFSVSKLSVPLYCRSAEGGGVTAPALSFPVPVLGVVEDTLCFNLLNSNHDAPKQSRGNEQDSYS